MKDISYVDWLKSRIDTTKNELDSLDDDQLNLTKGGKLIGYKECLSYLKTHPIDKKEAFAEIISYIEYDAEIMIDVSEMFNEDGTQITKSKYGVLIQELKEKFL